MGPDRGGGLQQQRPVRGVVPARVVPAGRASDEALDQRLGLEQAGWRRSSRRRGPRPRRRRGDRGEPSREVGLTVADREQHHQGGPVVVVGLAPAPPRPPAPSRPGLRARAARPARGRGAPTAPGARDGVQTAEVRGPAPLGVGLGVLGQPGGAVRRRPRRGAAAGSWCAPMPAGGSRGVRAVGADDPPPGAAPAARRRPGRPSGWRGRRRRGPTCGGGRTRRPRREGRRRRNDQGGAVIGRQTLVGIHPDHPRRLDAVGRLEQSSPVLAVVPPAAVGRDGLARITSTRGSASRSAGVASVEPSSRASTRSHHVRALSNQPGGPPRRCGRAAGRRRSRIAIEGGASPAAGRCRGCPGSTGSRRSPGGRRRVLGPGGSTSATRGPRPTGARGVLGVGPGRPGDRRHPRTPRRASPGWGPLRRAGTRPWPAGPPSVPSGVLLGRPRPGGRPGPRRSGR